MEDKGRLTEDILVSIVTILVGIVLFLGYKVWLLNDLCKVLDKEWMAEREENKRLALLVQEKEEQK